jgi:hypothetical protein
VRESAATMEESYNPFHQEEGIIVVQAFIDNLFEEALGFQVSSEYGGGHGTAEEELLVGGMRATRSSSIRFTEPQGRTEEPPIRPRHLTRSSAPPPYAPQYSEGFVNMTEEEEEKKLSHLERLVANVDFDDQALHILGFHMGHQGWVQFSNRVSANTHKEFALEILMTMTPILDEGVSSLSFRLEGAEQVVPYEY